MHADNVFKKAMDENIATSTPFIHNKLIPPPPRKLWSAGSPTEQLYRNKWTKYRNSIDEKDPWSALDSPHFVDFKDLPDVRDDYFDTGEETISTPQRFIAKQRLPSSNLENNNILEDLKKCTLSAIKTSDDYKAADETSDSSQFEITIKQISDISVSLKKNVFPTITANDEEMNTETSVKLREDDEMRAINVEKKQPIDSKIEKSKKKQKICTIVEPFSFENREKFRQEHNQARRERDSIGTENRKGFRATPWPNFLKSREKIIPRAKIYAKQSRDSNNIEMNKIHNAADIWKKKPFQPVRPKRVPIVPKAPNLLTAVRARERQCFAELMRQKEREKQEFLKKEEAARKKREEEELVKLRRELVHKAQPIRKYKVLIPKTLKRELTDPTLPIVCKRPRKF